MHKHSTVILLGILVVFLSAYVLWDNKMDQKRFSQLEQMAQKSQQTNEVSQTPIEGDMSAPDGGSIKFYPNEYVLIPELEIGFRKVPGITVHYTTDGKNVDFYTDEVKAAVIKDPGLSGCEYAGAFLPSVSVSTLPISQSEFQGYTQYPLGKGKYLNVTGQQAACYNGQPTPESLKFLRDQGVLFKTFLQSVQSY